LAEEDFKKKTAGLGWVRTETHRSPYQNDGEKAGTDICLGVTDKGSALVARPGEAALRFSDRL